MVFEVFLEATVKLQNSTRQWRWLWNKQQTVKNKWEFASRCCKHIDKSLNEWRFSVPSVSNSIDWRPDAGLRPSLLGWLSATQSQSTLQVSQHRSSYKLAGVYSGYSDSIHVTNGITEQLNLKRIFWHDIWSSSSQVVDHSGKLLVSRLP